MRTLASQSASVEQPRTDRLAETWGVLGVLVLCGAFLRFATLGEQSLWYDEGLTRDLVLKPIGPMLEAVADTENTPPLFYVLTHLATQIVGADEIGLRLASAIAGVATIPVAFLGGRRLGENRAGLYAAGLVAASPLLVWFSQEARSYALVSLLSAIAFVCFLRVISAPSRLALAGWALGSAAAVATHYFAIFPMVAEAAWMTATLAKSPFRRGLVVAVGAAGVAAAAIAPLAISQEASGRAESLADEALSRRVAQVPKQLLVGYDGPLQTPLALISAALLVAAAAGLWRIRHRREVLAAVTVAIAAILAPIVAAVVGADYLNTRNVLPGLVPVLILAAAGFAALRQPWGLVAALGLAAVGLVTTIGVNTNPVYQRTDWRSLDAAVGQSTEPRLLVASPEGAEVPLRAYRGGIAPAPDRGLRVREVLLAGAAVKSAAGEAAAPPRPEPPHVPGFSLTGRELNETYTIYRYRASQPVVVRPEQVAGSRLDASASILVVPATG